jgi:serine O-acetyltransferase
MISLLDYIQFCWDSNYIKYPKELLNSIEPFMHQSITQTIIDANEKYKGKTQFKSWEDLLSIIQMDPTIETVLFYRLERQIFLSNPESLLLPYLASTMKRRTGAEIYYSTNIGKGFNIQHGFGIVVGPRFKIGDYFTIHQGVTLGQKNLNSPNEKILIGNNVSIFANASILGNIKIGNNAKIGANSVLLTDVEENSVYAGVPAKRIK